jgi:hypothetical protein
MNSSVNDTTGFTPAYLVTGTGNYWFRRIGGTSCYNKCNSVGLNLVCEAIGRVEFPVLSITENCDTTSREVPIIIVTPPSPCEA